MTRLLRLGSDSPAARRRRLRLVLAAALAAWLVAPAAGALSLLDLNAGAVFASSDGSLTFTTDPGSVVLSGVLSPDLSLYTVTPQALGFRLSGPAAAADGGIGLLELDFRVSAASGMAIDSASLFMGGIALGSGAMALAGDAFSNGTVLGTALTGGGLAATMDTEAFAPVAFLDVTKSLQVITFAPAQVAAVTAVEQTWSLVELPEPAALALLGAGLLGLASMAFGGPSAQARVRERRRQPRPAA